MGATGAVGSTVAGGSGGATNGPDPTVPPRWTELSPPANFNLAGLEITSAATVAPDDFLFAASVRLLGAVTIPAQSDLAIVRWRRGQWTLELGATTSSYLPSWVSATAPDDAWAVLGGVLHHHDGQGWSPFDDSWRALVQAQSSSGATSPIMTGPIRAAGSNDVWAIASGFLLHWTAGAWHAFKIEVDTPALFGQSYSDLWVAGPSDVWIGGAIFTIKGGPIVKPALLTRFDGTAWSRYGVGLWNVESLWSDGAAGLWMAIPYNDDATLSHLDAARNANGFVSIDSWPQAAAVHSLWGRAADDVWAAGDDVAHWDGRTWSRVADVPERSPDHYGRTIVTGDDRSVWLVSRGPRFFRLGPKP